MAAFPAYFPVVTPPAIASPPPGPLLTACFAGRAAGGSGPAGRARPPGIGSLSGIPAPRNRLLSGNPATRNRLLSGNPAARDPPVSGNPAAADGPLSQAPAQDRQATRAAGCRRAGRLG